MSDNYYEIFFLNNIAFLYKLLYNLNITHIVKKERELLMKNIFKKALLSLSLIALVTLTACGDKGMSLEEYDQEFEKLNVAAESFTAGMETIITSATATSPTENVEAFTAEVALVRETKTAFEEFAKITEVPEAVAEGHALLVTGSAEFAEAIDMISDAFLLATDEATLDAYVTDYATATEKLESALSNIGEGSLLIAEME